MGGICCREDIRKRDEANDPYIITSKESEEPNRIQDTCHNEQKLIERTMTKTTEKPLYGPILPIRGDFDSGIEIPLDEAIVKEQKPVEQSNQLSLPEALQRGPTNFKIEPVHFRKECTKESFMCRYSSGDIIGSGSFGVVKKIEDLETGVYRAVKIISKDNCQHTDNFADEIEIIKKLDHPNIVRFYEFCQDEESYYIITEYSLRSPVDSVKEETC
eukprot:TRINITY_DN12485_c0_g5_i1.p1 TRINITY_DN12485_c0_g5~~TRINITY_DN12485_c0_g5_i1.p1  ORF type:complete len:216 (+),score=38.62 TRINITY_DN12485_c0_g5_i1:119-766(+)